MVKVALWELGSQGIIRLLIPAEDKYKGGIQVRTL
jgi:hypothetical protein